MEAKFGFLCWKWSFKVDKCFQLDNHISKCIIISKIIIVSKLIIVFPGKLSINYISNKNFITRKLLLHQNKTTNDLASSKISITKIAKSGQNFSRIIIVNFINHRCYDFHIGKAVAYCWIFFNDWGQNWTESKLDGFEIGRCQNWTIYKYDTVKIG